MTKRKGETKGEDGPEAYSVEAIVSVDERGQLVLPKSIRQRMGIVPGDRLALVTMEKNGRVCCLNMFKASHLADQARIIVTDAE
jgi:antitoxin PrlF